MDSSKNIPLASEWGPYKDDPELSYAYEKFGGKTLEDVAPYFEAAPLGASECLYYMPTIPFRYYVFGFKRLLLSEQYLKTGAFWEAPNASSTFLILLRSKLQKVPNDILPIMNELMPVVEFVANNQSLYGANPEIYGDYKDMLSEIENLYNAALKCPRSQNQREVDS